MKQPENTFQPKSQELLEIWFITQSWIVSNKGINYKFSENVWWGIYYKADPGLGPDLQKKWTPDL